MSIPGTFSSMIGQRESLPILYIGNAGKNVGSTDVGTTDTFNASTAVGDLLLCFNEVDDARSVSTPSGWTQFYNQAFAPYSRGTHYYKIHDTGSTVFLQQSGGQIVSSVLTFRNTGTNFTMSTGQYDANNNGTLVTPSIVTPVDNCFVLFGFTHDAPRDDNNVATSWTNANISSASELLDITTSANFDGGICIWGGYKTSAGNTGTTTVSVHTSVQGCSTFAICLLPV